MKKTDINDTPITYDELVIAAFRQPSVDGVKEEDLATLRKLHALAGIYRLQENISDSIEKMIGA